MDEEKADSSSPTTLVFGASENSMRYSWLAVNKLKSKNIPVVAVGLKSGMIGDTEILTTLPEGKDIDTITLYVGPARLRPVFTNLLALKPRRIIFNPGTEDPELINLAAAKGIHTEIACTLVMLSTGVY